MSSNGIDELRERSLHLQTRIPAAADRNEALDLAISAAELCMKALKLATDAGQKSDLSVRARSLLNEAERIKTTRDWRLPVSSGSTVVDPPTPQSAAKIKRLKEPKSTRELTKTEELLILRASKLNGFQFPPWKKPPDPSEFALQDGEDLFLDTSEPPLSSLQLEVLDGWKRASDALPPPSWFPGGRSNLGPTMHFTRRVDLVQDAATDCSVVASLCAGTARGERGHTKILSSVIYPYDQQNLRPIISPNGKYVVRLNFNGCYRKVIVDDLLPVSKTSRVLHVIDRRNPGLLWPALIEKAYLKVRGGYDFPGSNSGTDLWILCGWIPEQVFLQSDELVRSQLWKRVYSAFTYGDVLVTMGTGKISNRAERETGLAGEHDYAILDMKEVGDQKLFLIKNPWCEGTSWRGSITKPTAEIDGDATAQSTHELLNVHAELTPGTFWMDLNNVIQHFESIYLNWNPGLFTTREDIHFPWDLSTQQDCRGSIGCFISNPQFAVTCKKDDIVWLLLCRHLKDNASPIPPEHGSKIVSSGDMTGFISLYAFGQQGKRVLLSDNALERGPYVDSPQTLLKLNPTEDCTYTIVPSEQDLSPTLHTFTLSALARSPILLAEAAQKYTCQSVVKATWTPGTAGGNAHSPSYSQNPQFGLVITHNTSVSILLQTSDNTLNVHVKLVHGRGRRVHAVTSRDIVVDSGDYHRGCAHAELGELDAGTYTIICSTFESAALLALRRDPRILRLPPYVSALCILIGVGWLLLLPLNEYSRQTYVSENAILPGQVHTYFGGSEHNIFRAYRHEVAGLAESSEEERVEKLGDILRSSGLKVATQKYEYTAAGRNTTGKNVYAILQGPRADATEAVVLIAAWRNMDGVLNQSGVALVLTLARYFKRWSVWSKDIIFLIPSDSTAGPQAWVDAYHSGHDLDTIESLPIKSGALQAAVAVDYPAGPWGHRFDKLHIIYDGINGQLPNLDLFNTAVSIASGQMGIGCTIQRMWNHRDNYSERLQTMLRGMLSAGLGHATGPHSSFIPYHVDAITLQTVGDGWHDEMSLGRTVESLFRSLNNLLEHLHQSFFFYLLMHANRFVSIGTYLPGAMLFAVSFTIASVALWVQSGRPTEEATVDAWHSDQADAKKQDLTVVEQDGMTALIPTAALKVVERHMSLPIAFVSAAHFLGLLPLYIFTHASAMTLTTTFYAFAASTALLPALSAVALSRLFTPTSQQWALAACFSLLLLGLFLSALATLNFSLAILVGVLASPLCLVPTLTTSTPSRTSVPSTSVAAAADTHSSHRTTSTSIGGSVANVTLYVLLLATSPPALLLAACRYWNADVGAVLAAAGTAWHVQGAWTGVVVCLVWWPAWLVAAVGVVAARSGV